VTVPVRAAQYAALLARAVPSLRLEQIEGSVTRWVPDAVPMARGWALIHASCLLHGEMMVWPGAGEKSRTARWLEAAMGRVKDRRRRGRK
jgi:hypothetical protein